MRSKLHKRRGHIGLSARFTLKRSPLKLIKSRQIAEQGQNHDTHDSNHCKHEKRWNLQQIDGVSRWI